MHQSRVVEHTCGQTGGQIYRLTLPAKPGELALDAPPLGVHCDSCLRQPVAWRRTRLESRTSHLRLHFEAVFAVVNLEESIIDALDRSAARKNSPPTATTHHSLFNSVSSPAPSRSGTPIVLSCHGITSSCTLRRAVVFLEPSPALSSTEKDRQGH